MSLELDQVVMAVPYHFYRAWSSVSSLQCTRKVHALNCNALYFLLYGTPGTELEETVVVRSFNHIGSQRNLRNEAENDIVPHE